MGRGDLSDVNSAKDVNKQSIPAEHHPFISSGCVCFPDSDAGVPVTILRVTGANQSLILDGMLPFFKQTSMGDRVLIQDIAH